MKGFTKREREARQRRFAKQRAKRGWDDTELWSLDHTIGKFVLPRLERYKEITTSSPGEITPSKWAAILDEMIFAMKHYADKPWNYPDEKTAKRIQRGMRLFADHFCALWI
jgi:hypothetical protein